MFIEITDVGIAAQKPKQLVDDRFDVQFFCREEREPWSVGAQIKSCLRTKNR
jgi:hypothetical protein